MTDCGAASVAKYLTLSHGPDLHKVRKYLHLSKPSGLVMVDNIYYL